MGLQTRNSVLAIMQEVTEGTPVVPSGVSDYTAMQDDFTMTPSFEVLENAELKANIGKGKVILGAENPSGGMSHYLKHSAVEGQAPDYNLFLKAALGAETVVSTERNTVAGSTTAIVNVDTGEGVEFPRGTPMLIKDGTNGYSIRPSHSVSTDAITLGFLLSNAPGTGVDLGKSILYAPVSTGHISMTLWHYLANQGAIQMMAGARVTDTSLSFAAGELINANFAFEGSAFYFNPVTVTSANDDVDFNDGGVQAAVIASKTYKDPHELAAEIQLKMDAQSTDTITCVYSDSTGSFTIATDGATLSLLWKTGVSGADNTDTHIGTTIGFSDAADDTGALTYTADSAMDWSSPFTPSYDASDPIAAKAHEFFLGDSTDNVCFEPSTVDVSIVNTVSKQKSICAVSGIGSSVVIEREVTMTVTALLAQHDVSKFRKFRENEDTRALYNFGTKSAGNWIAGKCGMVYAPTTTISSFVIGNEEGQATLELELKSYIDSSGNNEIYIGFV